MFIRGFIVHNICKTTLKVSCVFLQNPYIFEYERTDFVNMLYKVCIALLIVGGINWGLIGILNFDLVAFIFGSGSLLSRIVYTIVGIAAICSIPALFSSNEEM